MQQGGGELGGSMEVVEGGKKRIHSWLPVCRLTVHNYRCRTNRKGDEMGHQESWLFVHLLLP